MYLGFWRYGIQYQIMLRQILFDTAPRFENAQVRLAFVFVHLTLPLEIVNSRVFCF